MARAAQPAAGADPAARAAPRPPAGGAGRRCRLRAVGDLKLRRRRRQTDMTTFDTTCNLGCVMQKVVAILEQHVQWIAIGPRGAVRPVHDLGYVITPPAQVTIGSESYGPGEVDPHTVETVVHEAAAGDAEHSADQDGSAAVRAERSRTR